MKRYLLVIAMLAVSIFSSLASAQLPDPDHVILYHETSTNTVQANTTYLIDSGGAILHTWLNAINSPGASPAYLREDGLLLRGGLEGDSAFFPPGAWGDLQLVELDGTVVWEYRLYTANQGCFHHDVAPMPNGNVLVATWEYVDAAAAEALGWTPVSGQTYLWFERILELQPDLDSGATTVVWEWFVGDHLVQDGNVDNPGRIDINFVDSSFPNLPPNFRGDHFHFNSIEYDAERDEIILSSFTYDEIWIIDHSTTTAEAAGSSGGNRGRGGDILYRWGNPEAYDFGGGSPVAKVLDNQHDTRRIPTGIPGEGNIMIHNNRPNFGGPGADTQILELVLPLDEQGNYVRAPGAPFEPAQPIVLVEQDPENPILSTRLLGGAQKLPNGNVFITLSDAFALMEVDSSGDIVWYYDLPGAGSMNKAQKYAVDYPGLPTMPTAVDGTPLAPFASLSPGTPNPFNPRTTIRYNLRQGGPVRLDVFDVTGRLVRTLVNETMSAGDHRVVWDGRDANGRSAASAVYFISLRAGGGHFSRKVSLLK